MYVRTLSTVEDWESFHDSFKEHLAPVVFVGATRVLPGADG